MLALERAHPQIWVTKSPNMLTVQPGCPQHQVNASKSEIFSKLRHKHQRSLSELFSQRLLALLPRRSSSLLNQLVEPSSPWVLCSTAADRSEGGGAGPSGFFFVVPVNNGGCWRRRRSSLEPRLRAGCAQTVSWVCVSEDLCALDESCGENQVCRRARRAECAHHHQP